LLRYYRKANGVISEETTMRALAGALYAEFEFGDTVLHVEGEDHWLEPANAADYDFSIEWNDDMGCWVHTFCTLIQTQEDLAASMAEWARKLREG
jgi:hypothetical protein